MPGLLSKVRERVNEAREYHEDFMAEAEAGLRDKYGRKTQAWYEEEARWRRRRERHLRHEQERREGKRPPRGAERGDTGRGTGGEGDGEEQVPKDENGGSTIAGEDADRDGRRRHRRRRSGERSGHGHRHHHRHRHRPRDRSNPRDPNDAGIEIIDPGNGPLGRELRPDELAPANARGGSRLPPPKIEMRPWLKKLLGKHPAQQRNPNDPARSMQNASMFDGGGPGSSQRGARGKAPGHPSIDDHEEPPAHSGPMEMPEPMAHNGATEEYTDEADMEEHKPAAHPEAPVPMPDEADFVASPANQPKEGEHLDLHTDSEQESEDESGASTKATTAPPNDGPGEPSSEQPTSKRAAPKQKAGVRGGGSDWDAEYYDLHEDYDDEYEYSGHRSGRYSYWGMPIPPVPEARPVPEVHVNDSGSPFYRYGQTYASRANDYSRQGPFFRKYPETRHYPSGYEGSGRASSSRHGARSEHGTYSSRNNGASWDRSGGGGWKGRNTDQPRGARRGREQNNGWRERPEEEWYDQERTGPYGGWSHRPSANRAHRERRKTPPKPPDYYAILGIRPDSSQEEYVFPAS